MKSILLALCLLATLTNFAQENKQQEHKNTYLVLAQLIDNYNTDQFTKIHQLLSDDFRKQTTEASTIDFYQRNLKKPFGKITAWEFLGTKDGKAKGIYSYSASFEHIKLAVDIMLTADQHINYINWKPFTEKKALTALRDPASIKSNNPKQTKLQLYVDTIAMEYLSDPANSSLAIGLSTGKSTETFFYGETKKGTAQLPDRNSLYEIASISKTFTAIMLAHAVNEGKIKLEDDIRKYLPGKFPNLEYKRIPIKIINLSNHTSGLPSLPDDFEKQPAYDAANPYLHYSKEMIYNYLGTFKPDVSPGAASSYSNLGFAVLGTILENVYGMPLEKLLERRLTNPLKMYHTHYDIPAAQQQLLVTGYSDQTGKAVPYWDLCAFKAAGGLKSNLNDMLQYLKANMTAKNKDFLLTYQVTDHQPDFERGMAWMIQPLKNRTVFWHNGGTAGFRSFCGFVKDRQTGIVVLSNSSASVDDLALKLLSFITYSVSPQK